MLSVETLASSLKIRKIVVSLPPTARENPVLSQAARHSTRAQWDPGHCTGHRLFKRLQYNVAIVPSATWIKKKLLANFPHMTGPGKHRADWALPLSHPRKAGSRTTVLNITDRWLLGICSFPKYVIKQQKPPQQVRLKWILWKFPLVYLPRLCAFLLPKIIFTLADYKKQPASKNQTFINASINSSSLAKAFFLLKI